MNDSDPIVDMFAEHLRLAAASSGVRQLIGIAGAPGTGKSTFADSLATRLGEDLCVVVPMDGFHLAGNLLQGTPLAARKGAIDTFDVGGFLSLMRRLAARDEEVVYAPTFRRDIDEPIAASIAVPAQVPIVITEGNYLLADAGGWPAVRELLTEVWFVDTPDDVRIGRLIERHVAFGKSESAARAWVSGPDEANARYVASTRERADRIIEWS